MRNLAIALTMMVLSGFSGAGLTGCTAVVGDACETQTDCGRTMFCERSLPGGYCTLKDCRVSGCPSEGVCIAFDEDNSWCMFACDVDDDCRDGYRCVRDFGGHGFCNDVRGVSPTEE